ncbi:unnamed protein product [Pylaiella littoralis]
MWRLGPLCCLATLAVLLPQQSLAFAPHSSRLFAPSGLRSKCSQKHPEHLRRHNPSQRLLDYRDVSMSAFTATWGRGRQRQQQRRREGASELRMLVDPGTFTEVAVAGAGAGLDVSAWSVTSVTSDTAAELFQASLLPYLAFLWFLSRKETKTPEGGTFGFAFLLVFVVATIPAGIYAKTEYNETLANVDYLHGVAESFLTLTNLFIVAAFRKAVVSQQPKPTASGPGTTALRSGTAAAAVAVLAAAPLMLAAVHTEPGNALSFPTWMVHVSSLIEWLAAMTYIWSRFADVSGLQEWKGLTWGMLPLHTSGLIACTYHIFYNSPELISLVAMQAGLTCFGNATMAFATWRVWQAGKKQWEGDGLEEEAAAAAAAAAAASADEESWSLGDDVPFYGQILAITMVGAAVVKWGELYLDFPFDPSYAAAAALILGPTALNAKKWADRSKDPSAPIESII